MIGVTKTLHDQHSSNVLLYTRFAVVAIHDQIKICGLSEGTYIVYIYIFILDNGLTMVTKQDGFSLVYARTK